MTRENYLKARPLLYSFLTGGIYFIWTIGVDFSEDLRLLYTTLMIFLPGVTFPITTAYYSTNDLKNKEVRILMHLILSSAIYHGVIWIFSGTGRYSFMPILAGLLGSLTYQLCSKFVIRAPLKYTQLVFTAFISGLVFIPSELKTDYTLFFLGFSIFLWTVSNGFLTYFATKNYRRQNA